jgi:hypothetical protein
MELQDYLGYNEHFSGSLSCYLLGDDVTHQGCIL